MSTTPEATVGWGPARKAAAMSITFDNLGEAMDLSIGTWPENLAVGNHYSVTEVLPKILDLLEEERVHCTYFTEGWSVDVYADAIHRIRDAGHDIAYHGWRHEHWPSLDSREREAELLARGVEAFRELGIELRGFRPPGGVFTPWTVDLLRENGFSYASPAAKRAGLLDGVAVLPFQWTAIDAYYFFDAFAPLRGQFGDPGEVLSPSRLEERMRAAIEETVAAGSYLALLFHPFLERDEERFDSMRRVIQEVARHGDVWCAPCIEQAEWVHAHRSSFKLDPQLDERSWQ